MRLKGQLGASLIAITSAFGPVGALYPPEAQAQEHATRSFDIAPGDLTRALQAFAEQSDRNVLFTPDMVAGRTSLGVQGQLTERQALEALLAGTGLRFEQTASNGYAVQDPNSPTQLDAADGAAPGDVPEEEIVVTGSRIRGGVTAPVVTVTRADIEAAGYSSVEEVFDSLPQNFSSLSEDNAYSSAPSRIETQNFGRASSIDLRGLGAQSTLTLVNGARRVGAVSGRAVDISTIPLAAVERVEIVTGGRSAIYGSDAVAGVANFITRRSFEGQETQVTYGGSEFGGELLRASHILGFERDGGSVVAAYEYAQEWPLNLVETGFVVPTNPFTNATILRRETQPDSTRHSFFLAGDWAISSDVDLYVDGLYARKNVEYFLSAERFPTATRDTTIFNDYDSEQWDLTTGLRANLGGNWSADASVGISEIATRRIVQAFFDTGFFSFSSTGDTSDNAKLLSASVVMEGPLFSIGEVTPRMAFGAQARQETFDGVDPSNGRVFPASERDVISAFGELLIPLVSDGGPGLRSMRASLAGRYDDYSDVGDTFNPQAGLSWVPFRGWDVRAAYSSSFRAPALVERGVSNSADIANYVDPTSSSGFSPVLVWYNAAPNLRPEEAESWTLALDAAPQALPWLQASLTYYDIDYSNRVETPAGTADLTFVLQREAFFPGLVNRTPTLADAAAVISSDVDQVIPNFTGTPFIPATDNILTVFPNLVIFDNRINNIASERVRGVDLSVRAERELDFGTLRAGLTVTYTIEHERSVTETSPQLSLLNEVGKPVDLRARGNIGFTRGPFGADLFVNYTGGYDNPFSSPRSEIPSWTTVDLSIRFVGSGGALDGVGLAVTAHNLLDEDPPTITANGFGVRYDGVNSSALGRLLTVRLSKRW